MKVAQIIRDGTAIRVEQLEQKIRADEALVESERFSKEQRGRHLRSINNGPGTPLGPLHAITSPLKATMMSSPPLSNADRLEQIYISYAQKIIRVIPNDAEMKGLAAECVAAVRRERPLSSPPEHDILTILESHIIRLQDEDVPETRTYDTFVNKVVDVSKTQTKAIE